MNDIAERRLRLIDASADGRPTMRIAIATRNNRFADETFGRASLFAIYEVAADLSRLVELIEFAQLPRKCSDVANDNPDDCERRVTARIAALDGCQLVFARRIGDLAAALAMKNSIHPVELARDEPIGALLDRCRTMLAGNPPPWLRRIIGAAPNAGKPQADPCCDAETPAATSPSDSGAVMRRTAR